MEFLHIGAPTNKVQANETYLEALKVYITCPDDHPLKFEYLRFASDSPMAKEVQENTHIAYKVDDLTEYLKMGKVVVEPFIAGEGMRIAFVVVDGVVIEFLEQK